MVCTETPVLVSSNLYTKLVADLTKTVLCRLINYPYVETEKKNYQPKPLILKSPSYWMPYTGAMGNSGANYPIEQLSRCCFKRISNI